MTHQSIQNLQEELAYWEQQREVHKVVYWTGSRGSTKRIWDMEDSYILNVIKSIHTSLIRARDLPFITEFQEYEGVKYETWLKWFTNEYQFRKALMNLKTEQEYQNWQGLEDLLDDDNAFTKSNDITLDDIPF